MTTATIGTPRWKSPADRPFCPSKRIPAKRNSLKGTENPQEMIDRLVTDNIKLAGFFAKQYLTKWRETGLLDDNEALSIAMEGLYKGALYFNPEHGCKFGSYATCTIKTAFTRYFTTRDRKKRGGLFRSNNEVQWDTELPERKGDIGRTYSEIIADPSEPGAFARLSEKERADLGVMGWVSCLKPLWARVIVARFGLGGEEPETLDVIALQEGYTRERIRQIQNLAIEKLRWLAREAAAGRELIESLTPPK